MIGAPEKEAFQGLSRQQWDDGGTLVSYFSILFGSALHLPLHGGNDTLRR